MDRVSRSYVKQPACHKLKDQLGLAQPRHTESVIDEPPSRRFTGASKP